MRPGGGVILLEEEVDRQRERLVGNLALQRLEKEGYILEECWIDSCGAFEGNHENDVAGVGNR